MPIPGEGHEGVAEDKQDNGVERFHSELTVDNDAIDNVNLVVN
ncbi:MAG: hypothetical protein BroJett042_21900 [Bacteroidota bacterium]|nr:MAG: hypothetical protein UZ12_BCD005000049 [Bacteroidetes bacterium OLB12]GIL23677.1 MAG: hypothetical protein BroJett042_21900 [Bacteroidota bacterium]